MLYNTDDMQDCQPLYREMNFTGVIELVDGSILWFGVFHLLLVGSIKCLRGISCRFRRPSPSRRSHLHDQSLMALRERERRNGGWQARRTVEIAYVQCACFMSVVSGSA